MGDFNEALFGSGSGAPGFKFASPGDTISGYITHLDAIQDRDFKTKELKFWPSGDKLLIGLVTVQTDLRDPTIPEDDGQRTAWIRGRYATEAVRDAIKKAGKRKMEEGGRFMLRFSGLGAAEKGLNPPKLFEARYAPPTPEGMAVYQAAQARNQTRVAAQAANDDPWANVDPDPGFLPTPAPAQAAPAASADPWGAPAPASTPQAAQQARAAGNGASSNAGAGAPQQEIITLPGGQQVDLATLPPEAAALMRKMNAQAPA